MSSDHDHDAEPVVDEALEAAVADYYAQQQPGLPPPLPNTLYLREPHLRYLRTFYPRPRPVGGWPHERGGEPPPPFDDWLRAQGIVPAADLYRQHAVTATPPTAAPAPGARPDSPPAA